jgi:F0F1-type ATP synthase delta subunit
MKLPRYQLAEVLAKRSLGSFEPKAFSSEIAAYLLDEGRTGDLDSLIRDIIDYRAQHGIVEVRAVSAHTLTSTVAADVTKQVKQRYPEASDVVISPIHDERVIGGVRLELPNEQLDLSVRAKLSRFKQLTTAGRN